MESVTAMTSSHPIVDAYTSAVNARDLDALLGIFREDAVFHNRTGEFSGHDEIAGFAREVIFTGDGVLSAGEVLSDGNLVMAEVIVRRGADEVGRALDVFRLVDGKVSDLTIFYRTRHHLPA